MVARRTVLGLLAVMLALPGTVVAQNGRPLTVFAAASLTDALGAVGRAYTRASGQPVRFSFESSGTAARQIQAGAKADVFVSADAAWMDRLQQAGRLQPGARATIAGGRLMLIAPAGRSMRLTIRPGFPLVQALGPRGRLAVGDPASVPAGIYAREALTRLGVWNGVAGRLAPAQDVRAALAYVARGEAPLGVVYETDAAAEPRVRIVGVFPAASHAPIVYPAAVVRGGGVGAAAFFRFLQGRPARAILRRYRFQVPG